MFAIPSNWQQTHNIVKYMSEVLTCPNAGQLHREIHAAAQGLPQESCSALGGLHTGWAVKTAGAPELSPPDVPHGSDTQNHLSFKYTQQT